MDFGESSTLVSANGNVRLDQARICSNFFSLSDVVEMLSCF
jgi:hypothetical protein